ncbi:Sodium-coupled monocarboxylate transporter 1 [Habropoda laboriosa]|uniref:Sodium-coupled monocarboxylate transporter 1 n=1 Tax=Habropoda laboriosa TaxID=597456 RepID=A0A0L7R024_9HYME|nr:Sodium-coupled monocarboxylate transporter 1 [Habropoda laboriosa]
MTVEGSMEESQPNWSVQEVGEMMRSFGVWDYTVFTFMLASCGSVGIYFGFIKKSSGVDEYLVGGRNMKTFPVSLSLIASFISGISLLGTPTEVYVHGTSYLFIGIGVIIVGFLMSSIYLPIFHELKLTSTYEYLERRFDKKIRLLGSVLFSISIMTWLPIVIYVPALAFNQVTGVNVHVVTPFVCIEVIYILRLAGAKDQLLPLLVMNILREFPGLPGLFVAGVFSAALSSLSTGLNSMAAVVLEDFIKPFKKTPFSPKVTDILLKLTVVILGVICVALVFVVEKTGSHVLQLSTNLASITSGPSLGIFSMGILLPWVNAKGALIGGLAGLGFMGWFSLSAEAAIASGRIKFDEKPVSTEGCYYSFPQVENLMLLEPPDNILDNDDFLPEPLTLYRLSYLWYTLTGALVTMSIGLVVSRITSEDVEKLDPMLLAPFIRKLLKNKETQQEASNV